MINGVERFSPNDLSLSQFRTIMTVYRNGHISMTELSRRLGVSPPSSSVMIEQLVEKGIFRREYSKKDRRKINAHACRKFQKDIK
jgi:DNA-binding MarR family transcriptional regulator